MGVKFGMVEGTFSVGPQKLKFLLRFDQNALQERIPCAIITKFAEFVRHFRMR